jgi:hypothetical protein
MYLGKPGCGAACSWFDKLMVRQAHHEGYAQRLTLSLSKGEPFEG